jgi:hypothetical protein
MVQSTNSIIKKRLLKILFCSADRREKKKQRYKLTGSKVRMRQWSTVFVCRTREMEPIFSRRKNDMKSSEFHKVFSWMIQIRRQQREVMTKVREMLFMRTPAPARSRMIQAVSA